MPKIDSRGRKVGYNWWREYVFDLWWGANEHWKNEMLDACHGHATEEKEFRENWPQPTFKQYLVMNAKMTAEPDA